MVLNGLPRHVGQAYSIVSMLDVRAVVQLHCKPEVVGARIANNTGGDRTGRIDDFPLAIECKLQHFGRRTVPLVDHYRAAGATMAQVEVEIRMTAVQMLVEIERQLPSLGCQE